MSLLVRLVWTHRPPQLFSWPFPQVFVRHRPVSAVFVVSQIMARGMLVLAFGCMCLWALSGRAFVNGPATQTRQVSVSAAAQVAYETDMPAENGVYPVGNAKRTAPYGERDPLPEGYGIRTGLSDLLKPLNAEAGVVAKEDSIPTVLVMVTGIVMLFLFYLLLLLLDNQSVLLPPEDEFDEYAARLRSIHLRS